MTRPMTRHPDMRPAKKYDAFISYSRDPDGAIARELQYGLQHVNRGWLQRRSVRVFLDKTTMPVGGALWGSLQAALDDSRYLVLIASPASASRPWVSREVAYWISDQTRLDDPVIVLADGSIRWDDQFEDFDWSSPDNALPAVLAGKFKETPVFADFRGIPAKRGNEDSRTGSSALPPRCSASTRMISAAIDRRQERRNRRIAATALTGYRPDAGDRGIPGQDGARPGGREAGAGAARTVQATGRQRDRGGFARPQPAALLAVQSDLLSPTAQARAALFAVYRQPAPAPGSADASSRGSTTW